MLVGLKLVAAQPPRQMAKQLVRPLPVAQNPQCDQSLPHFASRLRRWSRRPRPMEVGVHHSWSRLGTRQSGNGLALETRMSRQWKKPRRGGAFTRQDFAIVFPLSPA